MMDGWMGSGAIGREHKTIGGHSCVRGRAPDKCPLHL